MQFVDKIFCRGFLYPNDYFNKFFVFLSVKTQFKMIGVYILPHCNRKVLNDAYYNVLCHKGMSK
jgi:hypothetical protein